MGNIASCVGKDAVVDIGVFERRVRILIEAIEEQDDAQGDGSREQGRWRGD